MPTKFGLIWIGLSGDLEEKIRIFHFGTEIQDGRHAIFFNKYNLLTQLVMPTKFGLIWIGLRGLKIPDKKRDMTKNQIFHFGTEIQDGRHVIFFNKYNVLT